MLYELGILRICLLNNQSWIYTILTLFNSYEVSLKYQFDSPFSSLLIWHLIDSKEFNLVFQLVNINKGTQK